MSNTVSSVLARAGLAEDHALSSVIAACVQGADLSEEGARTESLKRLEEVVEGAVSALISVRDWGAGANGSVDADALIKGSPVPLNRQVFIYQLLSEGKPLDCYSLADVDYETSEGRCVGSFVHSFEQAESVQSMAEALVALGSEPEFFMLYGDD